MWPTEIKINISGIEYSRFCWHTGRIPGCSWFPGRCSKLPAGCCCHRPCWWSRSGSGARVDPVRPEWTLCQRLSHSELPGAAHALGTGIKEGIWLATVRQRLKSWTLRGKPTHSSRMAKHFVKPSSFYPVIILYCPALLKAHSLHA